MQRKSKLIGLMFGMIMMVTTAGLGTAFAATQPASTEKTTAAPDEKTNPWYYGKVKKIENDRIILAVAEVVWEKNSTTGQDSANVSADFETDTMKWKLDGKTIEIKTDRDTKYYKEMVPAKIKEETGKENQKPDYSGGISDTESKGIELKNIREGILAKVTLKDTDSMLAADVLMLSNVREIKPA